MKTQPLEKDPTFLTRTISSLTDQIDLFETFQDLSLKIVSQFDLKNILETFCNIANEILPYHSAGVYLFDEDRRSFTPAYHAGSQADAKENILSDRKIIDWVMERGKWTVLTDFQDGTADSIVSVLPLRSPQHALGFVIVITAFEPSLYNRKLSSIMNFLASQTAIAVENQSLYARIQKSNAFMANMLESINNGIMTVDMKGCLTLINKNATAILGVKTKKRIGIHYHDFIGKCSLRQEVDSLFAKTTKNGFALESMVTHSPYEEVNITVGISTSILTNEKKQSIGVIFVFRDMSASTEIERLTKLDKMKSEFVSNVSHELRTPLSIIKSYSEALSTQVGAEDKATREKFLSVIDSETDRLSGIVSNLLDLSRIEAGSFSLNYKPVSLKEIVNSVISVFKAKPSSIDVFTDFVQPLPDIEADEEKIREVLINLIANSFKFSPTGGIVNISVEQQGEYLACSVSDTGIGIPADKLDHIFEKFFRVDNSDTYEIEGTGLGLSIVKHIIEAHNGRIEVESILGKGSVFTFFLPLKRN